MLTKVPDPLNSLIWFDRLVNKTIDYSLRGISIEQIANRFPGGENKKMNKWKRRVTVKNPSQIRSISTKYKSENESQKDSPKITSKRDSPLIGRPRYSSVARATKNDTQKHKEGYLAPLNKKKSQKFKIKKPRMSLSPIKNTIHSKNMVRDRQRRSVFSASASIKKRSNFRVSFRPNSIFLKKKTDLDHINHKLN